jgi:short-subunit dehydrogenase
MNAVVTGGSKGLGKAIALKLAEQGFNLFLSARSIDTLETTAQEIRDKYKVNVDILSADLSVKSEVKSLGEKILSTYPEINVLVNNAGVFKPGLIHQEEDDVLESQIATNLYSAYNLTKILMPTILNTKNAHIFNMCSVASIMAYPNGGSYSISKFALYGFSKVLREEMKPYGIKVTSILPGGTWSDSWKGIDLPYERLMEAEDIAKAVIACLAMSPAACVEEILMRPQLGDL